MTGWGDLRFNVARFRHRHPGAPGTMAETVLDFAVSVGAEGLSISTARVPDGEPITVTGDLSAGINEFDLRAHVATRWEAECRRCLEPVRGELAIELAATFVDGDLGDEADVYPIVDEWVDVGAAVREEIMLGLPLTPLCSTDCVGADPDRFPTGSDVEHEPESGLDPRWAALSELTFDED